jgi:hypothetical protein
MRDTVTNSKNTTFVFVTSAVVVLLITLIALIALFPTLQAQTSNVSSGSSRTTFHSNNSNLREAPVFSANSKPYNLTYGEWTARWWQWAYSIAKNINPAYDDTGKNCAQKQTAPVWFLAGTYGHPVDRVCYIPGGKAILFPILNSECSFAEFPKLKTLYELRICAKTIQDQVSNLTASIDEVPISNLEGYRIQSPSFNFSLPRNNILGLPANTTTEAIADGNWVFLRPLSTGYHKIMFKGEVQAKTGGRNYNNVTSSFAFPSGWDFKTTYDLTVKNPTNLDYFSNKSSISEHQQDAIITTAAQSNIPKLLPDMVRSSESAAGIPVDWNFNGVSTDEGVNSDINGGLTCGTPGPGQLLNGFNDWTRLVYIVAQGLSGQTLQEPNEQTMNDIRGSRLVLLEGINNAIQRLIDSQPKTSIQKPTGEFDTTNIAQLLKTDQLGAAIEELTKLDAKIIKSFGEKAADKEVVPQIQNLIGALKKQEFSPAPSASEY